MKTYQSEHNEKMYQYFYDPSIRSWTVYEIDAEGFQVGGSDYFPRKTEMLKIYKFK